MTAPPVDSAQLLGLLNRHYIKPVGSTGLPGGVFVPEVGQNGGWGSGSRCDAIYVGFTSSSGRLLVGHELKVSRSDWLNELSKPGKADTWADECHEWWLVVADPAIVHEGELPAHWGLMSPGKSKTRMQIHTRAVRKNPAEHRPSWDAVRSIMARQDTLRAQANDRARHEAYQAATAEVNQRVEQRIEQELAKANSDNAEVIRLRDQLRAIEKALGCTINWSDRPGYGMQTTPAEVEQVRQVLTETRSVKAAVQRLSGVRHNYQLDDLQRAVDTMRAALADLREDVRSE